MTNRTSRVETDIDERIVYIPAPASPTNNAWAMIRHGEKQPVGDYSTTNSIKADLHGTTLSHAINV